MGVRITSRSRPRYDYPWPYHTGEKTQAEMLSVRDSGTSGHINFMGPFSLAAVMEMLYRVKTYQVEATLNIKYPEGTSPPTADGTMSAALISHQPFGGTPLLSDEISIFSYNRDDLAAIHEPIVFDSRTGYVFFTPVRGTTPAYPVDQFEPPISVIKDENGEYWLDGNFECDCYETLTPPDTFTGDITAFSDGGGGEAEVFIDVQIILQSGTFTVRASALGSGSETIVGTPTLSFTATEWFPYATTTGDPAWDTTTGEAINGGPGA